MCKKKLRKSRDVWDVRTRLERDAQGNLSGCFAATKFSNQRNWFSVLREIF